MQSIHNRDSTYPLASLTSPLNIRGMPHFLHMPSTSIYLCLSKRRLCVARSVSYGRTLRGYATDKEYSSVLNQRKARAAFGNAQTVGPFMLGNVQSYGGEKVKTWNELSASGKVARTTARTSNLLVVLFGAGLSALLVYALATELYAESSPTVLYADACNMISESDELRRYLRGNLKFYNNPPLEGRPQHRNRGVAHHIMLDSRGVEHMYINFFINSTQKADPQFWETPLLEHFRDWYTEILHSSQQLTLSSIQHRVRQRLTALNEALTGVFHVLTNQRVDRPPKDPPPLPPPSKPVQMSENTNHGWGASGMFGMFDGLRRKIPNHESEHIEPRDWEEAEVHADLVRTSEGRFQWRYLLVDIPSSRHPNPRRVFIRRAPDVRNNERVVLWQ